MKKNVILQNNNKSVLRIQKIQRNSTYLISNPKENLMERRIATALILIESSANTAKLNSVLSNHSEIIIGRQGIPLKERGISIISLILDGNTDQIGSLTGQIGKLEGIQVKSATLKFTNQN